MGIGAQQLELLRLLTRDDNEYIEKVTKPEVDPNRSLLDFLLHLSKKLPTV